MGEPVKATDEVDADAAAANQISWLSANPNPGSRRHPRRLSIKPLLVESALVAHHVERGPRQLVGQGLGGDGVVGFIHNALINCA